VKPAIPLAIAAFVLTVVTACGSNPQPAPTTGRALDTGPGTTTPGSATRLPSRTSRPATTDSTGRPCPAGSEGRVRLGTVNAADADAVAEAVVLVANQSDTRTDSSTLDALLRARRWLSPDLLASSLAVPERPTAAWTALVAHCGYTTVENVELANEYGQPPATSTTRNIQISYLVHDLGRDGWRGRNIGRQLARMHLIKTGHTWQVNAFG
jgi:hypothetical protein